MHTHRLSLGVLASVFTVSAMGLAQVGGVVRDSSKKPVEGAIVTLQASDVEAKTDASGAYSLPGVSGADLRVVAAKAGYYYGVAVVTAPTTSADLELEPVPTTSDPDYAIRSPGACGACHDETLSAWKDSPMGKAGKNTWVYDVYDGTATPGGKGGFVYTRDSVHAKKNPNSECASCHQPELWWKKPFTPLDPFDADSDAMAHGVSCEVCHKIARVDVQKPNFPGLYPGVVDVVSPGGTPFKQVQFGVMGDVTYRVDGTMNAAYQPQLKAEVCAACHQDKNDPDDDGDFEEPDGVVSEPTYVEWRDSPYADPKSPKHATCVDCHMKPTGAGQACSVQFPELKRPLGDVRSHAFPGTTPEFLENAVSLGLKATKSGAGIDVEVTIDNDKTGHHVPTGVTIRNMILLVEAVRASDGKQLDSVGKQVVDDLGGVGDPTKGYFAGLPGKLYAKVNGDISGKGPIFYTDATSILWDNRIPPLGKDTTQYRFALPTGGGGVTVRARLIYRRSWRALVDAKAWAKDGHGNDLADVTPPHFGHLMESAEQTVDLPCDPGGCGGGGGAAGQGAGGAGKAGSSGASAGAGTSGGAGATGGLGGSGAAVVPPRDSEDGGGCGCRSVESGPPALGAGLMTLALALGAARRRR